MKNVEKTISDSTPSVLLQHGGNLSAAQAFFPDAPQPWIDLSTGINPHAYPLPSLPPDLWTRLPEPRLIASLEQAAAAFYRTTAERLVSASGSQALIQLIPHIVKGKDVRIFGGSVRLTYTGHQNAWHAAGIEPRIVNTLDELKGADVAVLINPNNPDGYLVPPADLLDLASILHHKGAALVIDEAFMDFVHPRQSLIPQIPAQKTLILRSFGKAFGLAGLRIGFAAGSPDMIEPLRALVGFWAVSGPAAFIGKVVFTDHSWYSTMRDILDQSASRLDRILLQSSFTLKGGTSLFRLAEHPEASRLFTHLAAHGILTRPFADLPGHIRFGIPGSSEEWLRLEQALHRFNKDI